MAGEASARRPDGARGWAIPDAALPPSARELARAILLGGLAHVVVDVVAILAALPMDARLGPQIFFAVIEGLGVAGAMAAPLFALGAVRRGGWGVMGLYAALVVLAMEAALGVQLRRQATAFLDGRLQPVLYPVYLLLCGLAVPAAHLLGAAAGRMGRLGSVTAGLSLGGLVVGHLVHRDDYPGVHLAIFWVAGILGGATLAPRLRGWRGWRWAWAAGGGLALLAWLWPPPNAVRLALFREPGAVAPWALAQLAWRAPLAEAGRGREPPRVVPVSTPVWQRARHGLDDDPVIVLLTVDALRADVLRSGRFDEQLRQLADLRDRSADFTRATAPGSQTSVTLTSVFSGRYFSQLRWDYHGEGRKRFRYAAADPRTRFVETLTAAGVETQSFLALSFLAGSFGVARGFAQEHRLVEGRRHGAASEIVPPLVEAIERHRSGPAFFFAHLMEPHEPYDRGRKKTGPPFERYVSEIQVVDRWLGRVVRALRRRHPRRGYLIVTADHGEAFGEHGTKFHTKTLYEELIDVPLLVHGPGVPGRRIHERVSLIDLGPTILHLCGLPPDEGAMGISLLPMARGVASRARRPIFAEGRLRRAMVRGEVKVIEDRRRKTVEAYDLAADPGELHNLFAAEGGDARARAEQQLGQMRAFFARASHEMGGYEPPYKP